MFNCLENLCQDGVKDQDETDVDCGGMNNCPRCGYLKNCIAKSDCSGNFACDSAHKCSCFSADETVIMADGSSRFMRNVQVGDHIMTMSNDGRQMYLSEVMMIPHIEPNTTGIKYSIELFFFFNFEYFYLALFYTIETMSGHKLSLSSHHYLPVEHFHYLEAEQLTLNHSLYVLMKDGTIQTSPIRTIKLEIKTGVYNLFTVDGTFLVNGIAASAYTNNGLGLHDVKHRIFIPMRFGYYLSKYSTYLRNIYSVNEYGLHWILVKHLDYRNLCVYIDQMIFIIINFLFIELLFNSFHFIYVNVAKKHFY